MEQRKLRFALFGNTYQTEKSASIQQVLSCLERHGAEVSIDAEYYQFLKDCQYVGEQAAHVFQGNAFEADFVISMGGDGTFLDYAIESRALIQVDTDGEPLEGVNCALNDVAILKRDTASMISIRTSINGQYLHTYQADGLIVSTPTGSTAYSLSNGGPIIVPGTKVFSLTAVAPHSLNVRPIVLSDSSVIELEVESRSHNFLVAIDGRSEKCKEGTRLTLRRAPYDIQVVKRSGQRYFNTLREKMMWGADKR